jgi:hypothetical protein
MSVLRAVKKRKRKSRVRGLEDEFTQECFVLTNRVLRSSNDDRAHEPSSFPMPLNIALTDSERRVIRCTPLIDFPRKNTRPTRRPELALDFN